MFGPAQTHCRASATNENGILHDPSTRTKYVYDAEGHRVQKTAGGVTTAYVEDIVSGQVIEETNGSDTMQVGYVYLNGGTLAQYKNGTTYFVHPDHLGTTRLMTSLNQSVYDSMDFLPFGEQIGGSTGTTHKFTGKERDSESGLDEFGARYYSSTLGRFTIPDWAANATAVPYADFGNPQSLNLYAYVKNNPLGATDLDGHDGVMQTLLRLAGSTKRDPDRGAINLAVGAIKSFVNTAISATNLIRTSIPVWALMGAGPLQNPNCP